MTAAISLALMVLFVVLVALKVGQEMARDGLL
jgi:hypothetical protein